jgi:hypothetical protein
MRAALHDSSEALSLLTDKRSWSALPPSDAEAPLVCLLASIVVAETANLIALPFLEHDVAIRTELFVIRDAGSADVEKAHHVLLWVAWCKNIDIR